MPSDSQSVLGLEFEKDSDRITIIQKTNKLQKQGRLSCDQIWRGVYFKKEILFPQSSDTEVRFVNEKIGWGVFARRPFSMNEFIAEYTGVVRKRRWSDCKNSYCFEYRIALDIATPFVIDAERQGGVARFINHSQEGNLEPHLATVEGLTHIILVASRGIQKGEQLSYDYGSDYWAKRKPPQTLDEI